jgi:hypothetical protein
LHQCVFPNVFQSLVSQNGFPCHDLFHGVERILLLVRPFPGIFGGCQLC